VAWGEGSGREPVGVARGPGLAEYEDVLGRSALFARSSLDAVERSELLDIFLGRCRWTRIYYGWRPNVPDEGDNHLVELAVAGGAQAIVTPTSVICRVWSRVSLRSCY